MTEQEIKAFYKWLVDNGNRPLTHEEKEMIKQAIDKSKNIQELAAVAVAMINLTKGR